MTPGTIEVAFVGRIGREPQLHEAKDGKKAWLALSVAIGTGESTQWASVSVFKGDLREMAERCPKGTTVYVEGRQTLSVWTDKENQPHPGMRVSTTRIEVLGLIGDRRPKRRRKDRNVATQARGAGMVEQASRRDAAARDWQRPPAEID